MPELVRPTTALMPSFLEAMDEFVDEGAHDSQTVGWIARYGDTWRTPEGFAAFVDGVKAEEADESVLPDGWVLTSTRWWVEGDRYLGRIAVRRRLNEFLREPSLRVIEACGGVLEDVRGVKRRYWVPTA